MAKRHVLQAQAYLHAHGIPGAPQELDRMMQQAIERMGSTMYATQPERDLTATEARILQAGGADLRVRDLGPADPLHQGVADFAALLKTALTTEQAAKHLGVDPSRVRQRLTSRPPTLYGVKVDAEWRLPLFQFDEGGLVPAIDSVISHLSPDLHPLAVYRWLVTPCPDLMIEDERQELAPGPLSPRQWLLLGNPSEPVTNLAAEL